MALDQTTEIVSHFIGLFEIGTEEARLKEAYAAFRALKAEAAQMGDLLNITANFGSAFKLAGFIPAVTYTPAFWPLASVELAGPIAFSLVDAGNPLSGAFMARATTQPAMSVDVPEPIPYGLTGPAGSVATITIQTNYLNDADEITVDGVDAIAAVTDDAANLELAVTLSQEMMAISVPAPIESDGSGFDYAMTVLSAVQQATAPVLEGSQTSLRTSDEAKATIVVNGQVVDALPDIADVLPEFLKDAAPEAATDSADADPAAKADPSEIQLLYDLADAASDDADTDAEDDAADEDTADNEVSFVLSDEPEATKESRTENLDDGHQITTGGNQLVNEAAIVNSWLDAPVIAVANDVVSVKAISQVNVLLEKDMDETDALSGAVEEAVSNAINAAEMSETGAPALEDPTNVSNGMPANWFVSHIEGDVTVFNHVEQHNFVLDNDNVQIELAATRSEIVLGENNVVNVAAIAEIGFAYDLIIVAGNMVEISMIMQVNVLVDHDTVTYGETPPDAVETADNLVLNRGRIDDTGTDTYHELNGPLARAEQELSEGASMLPAGMNGLPKFDDMAFVRVLHIAGDFVTINSIEQRNTLGDSDHVQMILDDFIAETPGDVTVTAGANALMNIATIANIGMDSDVHVGGEVYSDALLYQAELIDVDAAPTGVGIPGLANEAVAFLAEGLVEDDTVAEDGLMIDGIMDGGGPSPDVLTSVLA